MKLVLFVNRQTSVLILSAPCLLCKIGWQKAETHLSLQHSDLLCSDGMAHTVSSPIQLHEQDSVTTSTTLFGQHIVASFSQHALVLSLTSLWKSGSRKIAKYATWIQGDSEQEAGCKIVTSGKEQGTQNYEFDEGVSKKKIMIRKNIKPISINCWLNKSAHFE